MDKKIVVIGSSNTDMVIKAEKLPSPGQTVLGGTFMMNHGGKGANQAVAVARLGGNVSFISKIGDDAFGKQSVDMFRQEGIDTSHIFTDMKHPSGIALITVDKSGENCIVVASGANGNLNKEDIDKVLNLVEEAEILLLQLEIPIETVEYVSKIANKKGVKVVLNPAPATALPDSLFESLYAIIPNETEAEILSGVDIVDWETAQKAANKIAEKGVEVVVITLGAKGALIKDGGNFYGASVDKVDVVDTTAAGDTFCGAFCVALSEGQSVLDAVGFANQAASIAVTRAGAQNSIPYRQELKVEV